MVEVTYIEHSGTRHVVKVEKGITLMEGAIRNFVPGIDADCGGACACATCHVYVDPEWMAAVGPANELETAMLSLVMQPDTGSRLACQISLDAKLSGLIVRLPKEQG